MNYTDLIADKSTDGSIKYWINYTRIDSAGVLDEAEKWIYSKLRIREMQEGPTDIAIAQNATSAALPDRFLDPLHFSIPGYNDDPPYYDINRFWAEAGRDTSGLLPIQMPGCFTIQGTTLLWNARSDVAYTGKLIYYRRPAPLSGANETNFLTDRYPTLLRRVCIMFAAEARKEYDSMDRSELKAVAMLDEIKKESDLAMRGMELDFNWRASR